MMKPWETEPDFVLFKHCEFACVIVRTPHSGHLCGYVAVAEGHPWFGKDYDDIPYSPHGGITYAEKTLSAVEVDRGSCWWVGFDCGTYRTVEYVKNECRLLAEEANRATS